MEVRYKIDANSVIGPNTRFWMACGHDYLFKLVNEPRGHEFLDRLARHDSIRFFRTHYTFSSRTSLDEHAGGRIGGWVVSDADGGYDFSTVNRTFTEYVKRGMKPIVEFDFFPAGMVAESEEQKNEEGFVARQGEPVDWDRWTQLLRALVENLIDTFGIEEIRTWYFEVWNEPDGWPIDQLETFFRLYDVFTHVVKSYDSELRVGGPACFHTEFLRNFLEHVVNGRNHVTGKIGSPIDFISYHIYGLSGFWLGGSPLPYPTVNRFVQEILWIKRLLDHYRDDLKDVEFHLNEWGLCSNYARTVIDHPQLAYRNNEVSPLFLIKLVDCLYSIGDTYDLETSMLLYWGFNNESSGSVAFLGNRELTTLGNIPKPILTGFEFLAKLGDLRLEVDGPSAGGRTGLIATSTEDTFQLLLYNYNEQDDELDSSDNFEIILENLSGDSFEYLSYVLDRSHHNTYRVWEDLGSPATLAEEEIQALMEAGELRPTKNDTMDITDGRLVKRISLQRHSVLLIVGIIK